MLVKKLTLRDIGRTYCCMAEASVNETWKDSLPQSRKWFKQNLRKHVEGYHLLDGEKVAGHIYFAPSQSAIAPFQMEPDVAYIYCTEMMHEYIRKGYGKMMFNHAKSDLTSRGFKGILVDASDFEGHMHHSHFTKQGFRVLEEHPPFKILYFPLLKKSVEVKPLKFNYTPSHGKVEVTLFKNSFCPVGVYMHNLIKHVAKTFGDKVKIVEIPTTLKTVRKYGTTDPLINGKIKLFGPASTEDIRKAIQEEINEFSYSVKPSST
jgi:hypothetical protein